MELQFIKGHRLGWARYIYIDLRNLLANPIAFTLPTLIILIVNLTYLNAVISTERASEHLLPIATFLLLSAFFTSLLSIPFEIRERYSDRIQIEFGSLVRRLVIRIQANALIGLLLTVFPYLALTLQNSYPRLTLDFEIDKFILLVLATIYLTTLGTLIGAIWRNYLALSLLGVAILILQVSNGFSRHSPWSFSSLVEKQLLLVPDVRLWKIYLTSIFICIQMGIVATSPLGNWLNRSRSKSRTKRDPVIGESRFARMFHRAGKGRRLSLVLKQVTSISAHMKMIPFTIFLFAVYPLISADEAFSDLSIEMKVPIVASLLVTSLFSCLISIGAYKLLPEERERDALALGGIRRFKKYTNFGYIFMFTVIGVTIFITYAITNSEIRSEIDSTLFFRPLTLIAIAVPLFSLLARKITDLNIDVRFFILFSIIIPIGEMTLSGLSPEIARYLPSSILATLAGGKGLYVLIYG
jgi:hypothetical protein